MKLKKIFDILFRMILFSLVVFIVVLIIGFFKDTKPNVIPEGAVSMNFPLKDGSYFIAFSGPGQDMFSGPVHQAANEKYALDITKNTSIKDLFSTYISHNNENNSTFGTKIYSPCFGNVKKVISSNPDMPIGTRDRVSGGNSVTVGCNGFNVTFSHMKQGSATVREGQTVKINDLLGQIGNSGNSGGPHLHLIATKTEGQDNVVPLPMTFNGQYLNRGDSFEN
jgi:hypothetical protein